MIMESCVGSISKSKCQNQSLRKRDLKDKTGGNFAELAVPRIGDGIEIEARDGVFIVLRTDMERGTLDVLQLSGIRQIEGGVPLGSVRVLRGENPIEQLQNFEN